MILQGFRFHRPKISLLGYSEWSIPLTRDGERVIVLMSWRLFQPLEETLEIMGDKELMESLRQSIREVADAKTIPFEDVVADLG